MILLCIMISFLGFIGIYVIDKIVNVPVAGVCDIDYRMSGDYVKVCGAVDGYTWYGNVFKVAVSDGNCTLPVLFYPSSFRSVDVPALMSGRICCEGRVRIKSGYVELDGDTIRKKE